MIERWNKEEVKEGRERGDERDRVEGVEQMNRRDERKDKRRE